MPVTPGGGGRVPERARAEMIVSPLRFIAKSESWRRGALTCSAEMGCWWGVAGAAPYMDMAALLYGVET